MKSMPAVSAMRASSRQSGQLADHRSGTLVAERPDEQFAPKTPILSALSLYMAMRACMDACGASNAFSCPALALVGAELLDGSLHKRAVDDVVEIDDPFDQALLHVECKIMVEACLVH